MSSSAPAPSPLWLVVMGVAGCGKSTLAQQFADSRGLPYIEGDSFHPESNQLKMRAGMPLNDDDRTGWLQTLGAQLHSCPQGAVLSCSALKRRYRDLLRASQPGLRFAFLDITPEESLARVRSRSGQHLFPPSLVQSQFDSLERPTGEPGVLTLDGTAATAGLCAQITHWAAQTLQK
jgi:gluconokinase